ncbi:Arrestin-N domain-containing protein [Mycena venus]|uniref:Arrestin-N domain-containing protein n=1 Tax=Mycena venus TaxID=2733690 RepID=A0A8H6YK39_9AGAR|nr:Arrestin-N domain-containing protein [Mycena venus]
MASEQQLITLHVQNLVRVAGETIEGRVDFHVPLALKDGIEHLRIEMQGVIKTQIYRQYGQTGVMHKQKVPLFSPLCQSLWTSSESVQATSDVLSYPFRFTLPENLPPSFCYGIPSKSLQTDLVSFIATAVFAEFSLVMPAAPESQLVAKESLRQGRKKMRQGIWGDYSHVYATLSLPDLPSFPIATPIPYDLSIVTETKTLDRSDHPEDKHGKPLFPAPPTQASELSQVLRRKIEYTVRQRILHEEKRKDTFDLQQSQNLANNTESSVVRRTQPADTQPIEPTGQVHVVVDEPEWVPKDKKDRGIWRRSVHFTSTIAFPFAPTCSTETLEWRYILQLTIPFPGIGNDLKLEVPISLGPSSACPPPPIGAPGSSNITYADVIPAGPPPNMLDLPPAYWASDDWDDETDEKK